MLRGIDRMGFKETTPVQAQTIGSMLEKKDMIVQAPTGSGKTCAFGIPLIEAVDTQSKNTQSVILCPTRELVIQTTNVLHKLTHYMHGIRIVAVYGGEPIGKQISALRRQPQIIVATPGRIMDHINRKTVKLAKVSLVVLDEADCMLDMGFRDDIDTILQSIPKESQMILFSATLSNVIKQIAGKYQNNAQMVHIKQNTLTVETVKQYYTKVPKGTKPDALKALLRDSNFNRILVFVGTKSMADNLTEKLVEDGFNALAIHGDLRQRQRDSVMGKYRKGLINILVATDVAARGIDVNDIDVVINFDIPGDSDSYVHRIGRTGRANRNGIAYTFIYSREQSSLESIIHNTKAIIEPAYIKGIVSESFELNSKENGHKKNNQKKNNKGVNFRNKVKKCPRRSA